MKKRFIILILGLLILLLFSFLWQSNVSDLLKSSRKREDAVNGRSSIQSLSYTVDYEGKNYNKTAYIYLPETYEEGDPADIFYLMHGSGMDNEDFAQNMQPLFDEWIAAGDMAPMIVVFPTYYPDDRFVVADYSEDYPLNHFFAETEIEILLPLVERTYTTYAVSSSAADLTASRIHRAFGGYSMGGITTWDILAEQSQYFAYYMPMAGDSWIGRLTGDNSDENVASLLVSGLDANGYTAEDFRIIAMVGENDGTKYSMIPQIEALRQKYSQLITAENLIYWENADGGHDQKSLESEVKHGLAYLFN